MGFTRQALEAFRDASVPDLIGPNCRLLFVGINPGLWTAATQTHFCHPSNRYYPALRLAGLIDFEVDPNVGMTDEQRESFIRERMGITNLVDRATPRAGELSTKELRAGGERLLRLLPVVQPEVVAVAGITAYRTAFSQPKAVMGPQPEKLASSALWVVPNPSGLNAHETIETLSKWYGRAATAAGLR